MCGVGGVVCSAGCGVRCAAGGLGRGALGVAPGAWGLRVVGGAGGGGLAPRGGPWDQTNTSPGKTCKTGFRIRLQNTASEYGIENLVEKPPRKIVEKEIRFFLYEK